MYIVYVHRLSRSHAQTYYTRHTHTRSLASRDGAPGDGRKHGGGNHTQVRRRSSNDGKFVAAADGTHWQTQLCGPRRTVWPIIRRHKRARTRRRQ